MGYERNVRKVEAFYRVLGPWLGWIDFDVLLIMPTCSAQSACLSSAQAGSGTAKIKVNPTQVRDLLGHPVQRVGKKVLNRNLGGLGERHLPVAPSAVHKSLYSTV